MKEEKKIDKKIEEIKKSLIKGGFVRSDDVEEMFEIYINPLVQKAVEDAEIRGEQRYKDKLRLKDIEKILDKHHEWSGTLHYDEAVEELTTYIKQREDVAYHKGKRDGSKKVYEGVEADKKLAWEIMRDHTPNSKVEKLIKQREREAVEGFIETLRTGHLEQYTIVPELMMTALVEKYLQERNKDE